MATITSIPLPDGAAKKIHKSLYMAPRQTISIVSGTTVYSFTIEANGLATRIILVMPDITGAVGVTAVVSIENVNSEVIYESAACGESDTHILAPDPGIPIVGTNTVKVTLSTNPLSSATGYATLYLSGN